MNEIKELVNDLIWALYFCEDQDFVDECIDRIANAIPFDDEEED